MLTDLSTTVGPFALGDLVEVAGQPMVLLQWQLGEDIRRRVLVLSIQMATPTECISSRIRLDPSVEGGWVFRNGRNPAVTHMLNVDIDPFELDRGELEAARELRRLLSGRVRLLRCGWMDMVPSAVGGRGGDAATVEARRQVFGAVVPSDVSVYRDGAVVFHQIAWPWQRV